MYRLKKQQNIYIENKNNKRMKKTLLSILLSITTITAGENITYQNKNKIYEISTIDVSIPTTTNIKYETKNIIKYIDNIILQELKPTKLITKSFIKKIISIESGYDSTKVGTSGERGLMQIMEGTYNTFSNESFNNAFNVRTNIRTGIKLLKWIEQTLSRDHPEWEILSKTDKLKMIGAAYNGGYTLLSKNNYEIELMKPHTIKYVQKIEF
jgi:soluble lytic murein transglycosylase-like protein